MRRKANSFTLGQQVQLVSRDVGRRVPFALFTGGYQDPFCIFQIRIGERIQRLVTTFSEQFPYAMWRQS